MLMPQAPSPPPHAVPAGPRVGEERIHLSPMDPAGGTGARWDVAAPGRYAYQMDVPPDGAQWMRFIDGTYGRGEE